MPYSIIKRGSYYKLRNKETGKELPAKHTTRAKAESARRAIEMSLHTKGKR